MTDSCLLFRHSPAGYQRTGATPGRKRGHGGYCPAVSLPWGAVIRRSAYTILLLTLAATAGLTTMFAGQVGSILSLACAGIGVVICGIAWASPSWRSGAGTVRHGLVTIAGLACLALVTMNVSQLVSGPG